MKTTTTKTGTFDCIDFKDRVQSQIYADIKDMTFEQEQAYFQERAESGKLGSWWKRIRARHQSVVER